MTLPREAFLGHVKECGEYDTAEGARPVWVSLSSAPTWSATSALSWRRACLRRSP